MGLLYISCCFLALIFSAYSAALDPRGARPGEHGYEASECATIKEWPACTDDDWVPKCPSGCRIQGLLDQADRHLVDKIDKIRKLLEEKRRHYRSTDQVTKQTYDFLRDRLVTDSGNDNKYVGLAEQLRNRIVSIKVKIEAQLRLLQALKGRVLNQVKEMKRLEVDIDIKLRSCKGSCASYTEYSVDRDSYVTLDKQLAQLEAMTFQSIETMTTLRVVKSTTLKDVAVPSISGAVEGQEQNQDYFADVDQRLLSLVGMATGSISTATISSDPVCRVWKQNVQPVKRERWGYPRGRGSGCPAHPQPPLCTDEDWDVKCPSGCRLQGVIDATEQSLLDRFGQMCDRAKEDRHKAKKTMLWTQQIHRANRKIIVKNYVAEGKYLELMDKLQKNLTSVKRRATELSAKLKGQYERIQQQIAAIYRTEVDVDIKIRACQGSCKNAEVYNIDAESYSSLEKELHEFHPISEWLEQPYTGVLKKKPLSDDPPILRSLKKLPFSEQELLTHFEDIEQYELEVENMTGDFDDR